MLKKIILATTVTIGLTSSAMATEFMDQTWAKDMCNAWNKSSTLTSGLAEWSTNNKDRGYKLIQIYRTQCDSKSKIQLNIANKDGKAMCVYGGKPDGKKVDTDVDYIMNASDEDWTCMGKGSFGCGAMGAMMSGKLKFTGPKGEAMTVMGPFGAFLELTGSVAGTKSETCPQ
ncbi:MAG: SCP2 sterol-binding domain-containing protein [Sulfurovum sp.]|uniref:SCP2 sterol-binding domain-containing protein n=1 Tax=Sulfurovum sp. TaxID=1969726 RepID=UPI003C70961D